MKNALFTFLFAFVLVVNAFSATEVECIVDPDSGAGYDYTSLSALITGEVGGSPACVTGADLVSNDEQLTIVLRSTSGTIDTTAVDINGFTTDATRYIKVWTDTAESYRHSGTYPSGNKYRLECDLADGANCLLINDTNVSIDGLALTATRNGDVSGYAITINEGPTNISNSIIRGGDISASGIYYRGITNAGGTTNVWNTIIYGFNASGTYPYRKVCVLGNGGTLNLYNSLIYDCDRGYDDGGGTSNATNTICFGNGGYDFETGQVSLTTCADDDGDSVYTLDSSSSYANEFTDVGARNFLPVSSAGFLDNGTDDPGSGLYSDDIIEVSRTSTWAIGPFEIEPSEVPYTGGMMLIGIGSCLFYVRWRIKK